MCSNSEHTTKELKKDSQLYIYKGTSYTNSCKEYSLLPERYSRYNIISK